MLSTFEERKGHYVIIDAMHFICCKSLNVHLVICGEGDKKAFYHTAVLAYAADQQDCLGKEIM